MHLRKLVEHIRRMVIRASERRICVALDSELGARLEQLADTEQRSLSELVEEILWTAADERLSTIANHDPWQALTPREREVAALACMGYTNREIARQMVISPNTVKTHIRHVLRKFSVSSKIELRKTQAEWDFAEWNDAKIHWPLLARRVRRPETSIGART
jgi:DNA-binding CsgD family transcriptional regulator